MIKKKTLADLYHKQNLTQTEIANKLDCSRSTVRYWLKKYGFYVDKKPKPKKEKLKQMYNEHNSFSVIADKFEVSKTTVSRWFKKYNLEAKSSNIPNEDELKYLYYETDLTYKDIAKKYNVTKTTIANWLKKIGISHNRQNKKPSKKDLINLYRVKQYSIYKIADIFDVSSTTILDALNDYDINTRKRGAKLKKENYITKFNKVSKNEFKLMSEFKRTDKNITVKHLKCGNEFKVIAYDFLGGQRCPYCNKNGRLSQEEFQKRVKEKVGDEYTFLEKYITADKKIKVRHNKCGRVWPIKPTHFLNDGKRCICYSESKGERKIKKWLNKNNFNFKREYKIKGCRNKEPLPFDFAVFVKDEIYSLIEYDGIQHYEPTEIFGGKNKFKKRVFNDKKKDFYCQENNIKLIRIPYFKIKQIENILEKHLTTI